MDKFEFTDWYKVQFRRNCDFLTEDDNYALLQWSVNLSLSVTVTITKRILLYVPWFNFDDPPKYPISISEILRFIDFPALAPKLDLAQEPTVLNIEGSSFPPCQIVILKGLKPFVWDGGYGFMHIFLMCTGASKIRTHLSHIMCENIIAYHLENKLKLLLLLSLLLLL